MYTQIRRYTDEELRELRNPLTSREVAGVLGVSLRWVQTHTQDGTLPHATIGRTYRYDKATIFDYAGIGGEC